MTVHLPPLDELRAFIAIAERGRLNRAADVLGVTDSAVSHQLRRLEERLNVRLIDRTSGGAVLTAAGQRFHRKVAEALRLLEHALEDVGREPSTKVTVTLSRPLATYWLVPRYAEFFRRHPDIELQLLPTGRLCDLLRERIDLGLRYGSGHWPGLEAVPIVDERCFPVAAPHVAKSWREVGWASFKGRGPIVLNGTHADEWQAWCRRRGWPEPSGGPIVALESFDLVLHAGLTGAGLIMGRTPMIDEFLQRGDLVAPFGTDGVAVNRYFAVWPSQKPLSAKARTVLDWLLACRQCCHVDSAAPGEATS